MKELYLANMWPQIVTKRGVGLFEQRGFNTSGNWLSGNPDYSKSDRLVLPYADFGKPILITEATPELWQRTISYILFPDSLIGWNFERNQYLYQKKAEVEQMLLKVSKKLSSSDYGSELLDRTYGKSNNITVPLGIDTDSINEQVGQKHNSLRILWNHMWRSDKGTFDAFDLIASLAPKYSTVEFWIGQTNTWDVRDGQLFVAKCEPKLKQLQNMGNVRFFNRIKNQKEYWAWLNQVDISFSTAFQEGFGLSMMEQEATGIACVVPNAEAYPELHGGCLIVDRSKLSEGLQFLIQNPNERRSVSQSCKDNASKYDTSVWVEKMVTHLD